jgi:hypothetical protein
MNGWRALQIGYAQKVITPTLEHPVYLAGFDQNRRAVSVHDDLYVRAMALKVDDGEPVVLAAVDLIGLPRYYCLEIARRVFDVVPHLVIACTHTHHGPDTLGLWGPNWSTTGVDPVYMEFLKDASVQTVLAAANRLWPAALRIASVQVPGVVKNTRNPEIVDQELTCWQFVSLKNQKPYLTAVVFPCHPEVLGEQNSTITADYPATLCNEVQVATGAPCMFFPGALGGMLTPDVRSRFFSDAARIGRTVALAALAALQNTSPLPDVDLTFLQKIFKIPMTNPLFSAAMRVSLIPKVLTPDKSVLTETNLIQIGPLWMITVPGELFPQLGFEIKDWLRTHGAEVASVIGLANDELGYILPAEEFKYPSNPFQPADHYEETMSVSAQAGPNLMQAVRKLLDQIQ